MKARKQMGITAFPMMGAIKTATVVLFVVFVVLAAANA